METLTASEALTQINAYMARSGVPNNRWYVGITADVEERLFGFHRVPRKSSWYIWCHCASDAEARTLEDLYHKAGCKGAGGGGTAPCRYIYAYIITNTTVE